MSDVRRTILKAMAKKRDSVHKDRIWFNGRYHSPDSDDLPTWVRPHSPDEARKNDRWLSQWLADAAADPRSLKKIGGVALLGAGTYGATQSMTKRRKAND